MNKPLLEVRNLKTRFFLSDRTIYAVNGVNLTINEGQVLGIVGESGCGKSVTSLSVMRLVQEPGRIVEGEILLHKNGHTRDLLKLSETEMQHVRGNDISMIFQDPMTSLNPVLTIGYQIMEPLRLHRGMSNEQAEETAIEILERVGIPEARRRMRDYPHRFSGGMRQRVMIAIALACNPRLLIADEPTTSLDVTIQAQILDLLRDLRAELNTAVMIITHNLGVIGELAEQVAVMYAGIVVESGPVKSIFGSAQHPYTQALMLSIPRLRSWPDRLATIEGTPPLLLQEIIGCPFEPRCRYRIERCALERPPLLDIVPGHASACWVSQAKGGLENA